MSFRPRAPRELLDTGPLAIALVPAIVLTGNLVGPGLVLAWAAFTRTPWARLGLARPRHRWPAVVVAGTLGGVALRLVMMSLVMPLLAGQPSGSPYAYLYRNTAALPVMLFTVLVGAGFGEELVWRGFLFDRLRRWFGPGARTHGIAIVVTSVLFGLAHLHDQGWRGVQQSTLTGLVFAALYVRTGTLALSMVVHASFDVAAVAMIYAGV